MKPLYTLKIMITLEKKKKKRIVEERMRVKIPTTNLTSIAAVIVATKPKGKKT